MNQLIRGRRMNAVGRPKEDQRRRAGRGTEPEAAVAAMEEVAKKGEEMPPNVVHGIANAEVTPLPTEQLTRMPEAEGAIQGPQAWTQPEEGGGRGGRVTGARAASEAGVASQPQWDMQRASVTESRPLPLPLRLAAVTTQEAAVANHEAAVAAMQGASVAISLPLLLLGEPARTRLEAAVAAMRGATPGRPR